MYYITFLVPLPRENHPRCNILGARIPYSSVPFRHGRQGYLFFTQFGFRIPYFWIL